MSYETRKNPARVKIPLRLQMVSFFSGSATMIIELAGSRIVAPYFGTSLIVWTALIGIIMTSLCLGNWLGGSIADKRPEEKLLGRTLMFAAFITAITAYGSNWIMTSIQELHLNLYISSVYSAFAMFAPSSILLGMIQPFAVRLAMQDVKSSGTVAGKLSALNSAGSILGTFMGGFVLISLLPSAVILMLVATLLAFLSVITYTGTWRRGAALALVIMSGTAALAYYSFHNGIPFSPVSVQIDTPHNHISLAESIDNRNGRRVRVMITDPSAAQSLMYLDNPSELVSDYTKFYDLAFRYNPDIKRVLMLGGGGYSVPKHLLAEHKNVSVDVVELDEGITEVARKYFFLEDNPSMTIYHEDARTFLNRAVHDKIEPYDAIFMDTFNSAANIPFHLTTAETGAHIHSLLKPGGVLVVNIISSMYGTKSGVLHGIYKAFSRSFSTMMIFPANAPDPRYAAALQNIMLVAGDIVPTGTASGDEYADLLSHQWLDPFVPDSSVPVFTDSFAPVEKYALMQ